MENNSQNLDTSDCSVDGRRAFKFDLPAPGVPGGTRKDDAGFQAALKNVPTLSLVDLDCKNGIVYIANGAQLTTFPSSCLFDQEDPSSHLKTQSIGHDDEQIKALKVFQYPYQTVLMICIGSAIKFFGMQQDGALGDLSYEMKIKDGSGILAVDSSIQANRDLMILILDSSHTLSLLNFNTKALTQRENIRDACFVLDTILCVNDDSKILIVDPTNVGSVIQEHTFDQKDVKAVKYNGDSSLFIFYDDCLKLEIIEFDSRITREDIIDFDYAKRSKFEQPFTTPINLAQEKSGIDSSDQQPQVSLAIRVWLSSSLYNLFRNENG